MFSYIIDLIKLLKIKFFIVRQTNRHSVTFILDEDWRGSAVLVALRDLAARPVKTSRNVKRSSRPPGKRQRGIFARSDFLGVDRNKFKFTESQNDEPLVPIDCRSRCNFSRSHSATCRRLFAKFSIKASYKGAPGRAVVTLKY